jgi:short-subunit dehydrogenase
MCAIMDAPMEDTDPKGPRRRALVTGASSGIGRAFAEHLARDGYDLVLVARSREALEALAKELRDKRNAQVEVLVADLTQPADLAAVEERVAGEPAFDLLVNNAGVGCQGAFAESGVEPQEEQVRLNVLALTRLAHAALRTMLPRDRGAVINVSSLAALAPLPWNATYAATKAFVNNLTESIAEELRGTGVRVQALCPGFTRTNFQERAGVDPSTVPGFAWMSAEAVVEASLAALKRNQVVCVPGAGYRVLAALEGALPRGITRRALAAMQARRQRN